MDAMQRMLPLSDGRRIPLKLSSATWKGVDWLAAMRGVSWQDWCRSHVENAGKPENITGTVRAAAMDAIISQTIFAGRPEQLEAMQRHPLMRDSASLNDEQYAEIMKGATVEGSSDFGGFAVHFGKDEHDQPCVWIRNGLREGLHFAFVIPSRGAQ
jgi:hypothetical protein